MPISYPGSVALTERKAIRTQVVVSILTRQRVRAGQETVLGAIQVQRRARLRMCLSLVPIINASIHRGGTGDGFGS
jgi:hypothetical protein